MKNKLIAAAIAAALVAPMAAHADTTVYGKLDVSVDSIDTGGTDTGSAKAKSLYGSSNSSRFGVKGSEDLGGGLKAVYGIEWGVGGFGAAGDLSQRNRSAGLAGGFGTVELGYQDSPMKRLWTSYDINLEHVGDLGNVTTANDRLSGVQYTSPKLGGSWVIQGAYQPDQGVADKSVTSIAVNGMAGPVKLGIGTENRKTGTGLDDQKTTRLAASMKFGMAQVNAFYSKTDFGGGSELKTTALQAKFGFGGGNDLRVGVAQAKTDVSDEKATLTTIGFDHHLSKKTFVYVDYATAKNDPGAYATVDHGAHGWASKTAAAATATNGDDPKAISVGVVVAF